LGEVEVYAVFFFVEELRMGTISVELIISLLVEGLRTAFVVVGEVGVVLIVEGIRTTIVVVGEVAVVLTVEGVGAGTVAFEGLLLTGMSESSGRQLSVPQ
jgi:hypothetical protein